MLAGTEPSRRPARLLSPRLPTTHRSALRSSIACTSTSTGSPGLQKVSILLGAGLLRAVGCVAQDVLGRVRADDLVGLLAEG